MYADEVVCVSEFEADVLVQLNEYEYLIIVESDEMIRNVMESNLGVSGYQGIYDVDTLLIQLEIDEASN